MESDIVVEVGKKTREHAVVLSYVTSYGFTAEGKLVATREWLDSVSDAELGRVVLAEAQKNLASRLTMPVE